MKSMLYNCGYDQTVKLLLVLSSLHSVTSCCEVSKELMVTWYAAIHLKFLGGQWNHTCE